MDTPPPTNRITLTSHELLALIDVDETLVQERGWLARNTFAVAKCTVISRSLAERIAIADPHGSVIHLEEYRPDGEIPPRFYTAWHPQDWAESEERTRLSRYANSTWRAEVNRRAECGTLVAETVAYIIEACYDGEAEDTTRDTIRRRLESWIDACGADPGKLKVELNKFKQSMGVLR